MLPSSIQRRADPSSRQALNLHRDDFSKRLLSFALLCGCTFLAACGGGGGGGGGAVGSKPETTSLTLPTAADVHGVLVKGPVSGAACRLQLPDGNVLTARSNQGHIYFGKSPAVGEALATCTGGSYTDEATGQNLALSAPLRTMVQLNSAEKTAVITPLSELALRKSGNNFAQFQAALQEFTIVLGLNPQQDYVAVLPLADGNAAAQEYAAVLAAITHYQQAQQVDLAQFLKQYQHAVHGLTAAQRRDWLKALGAAGTRNSSVASAIQARLSKPRLLGTLSGLPAGQHLTLDDGNGQQIQLKNNGPQVYFESASGTPFRLKLVGALPQGLNCIFTTATPLQGQMEQDDIGRLDITCSSGQHRVGGAVHGLPANASVTLRSNTGENLILTSNGAYQFKLGFNSNTPYSVAVLSPNSASCSVDWGKGKVLQTSVQRVNVHCLPQDASGRVSKGMIRAVDIAQTLSQPIDSPYQLLVPSRKALLRAFIYRTGADSPSVTLKVNGADHPIDCHNFLPDADTPLGVPIYQYDNHGVCTTQIGASEIRQGLTIELSADQHRRSFLPKVNTSDSRLQLKLIPLTLNGQTASLPDDSSKQVQQSLWQHFPLQNIEVQVGPAVTIKANGGATPKVLQDWDKILTELETLRTVQEPNTFYYGLLPDSKVAGLQGLAFTDDGQQAGLFRTGIGLGPQVASDWLRILKHEFGHNLSLLHAQCDRVQASAIDPFWQLGNAPIAWNKLEQGKLSAAALMHALSSETVIAPPTLISPASLSGRDYDVMSYCDGEWLSEYNYHKVASYIQAYSQPLTAPKGTALLKEDAAELSRISGSLRSDGHLQLNPVITAPTLSAQANVGSHRMHIKLSDGSVIEHYFTPVRIDHDENTLHFAVHIDTQHRSILSIAIEKDGQPLAWSML